MKRSGRLVCVAVRASLVAATACCLAVAPASAQPGDRGAQDRPGLLARMTSYHIEVPAHPFDIVLVRPTQTSVTLSVVAYQDCEGFVEFTSTSAATSSRTPLQRLAAGEPALFVLRDLKPDTEYSYRWMSRQTPPQDKGDAGPNDFTPSERHTFHTPRPPGSSFTFTVIADSHLDANMTPAVYEQTLTHALADKPDLHFDLGDTFMTDKRGREFKAAQPQYVAQRYYLGTLCHSAPLFLVLGNHDGEWGYASGGPDSMASWSYAQRTRYFPPPEILDNADAKTMFSGRTAYAHGQGANYYAFTWGDAQFIVLDPFWFTREKSRGPGGRGGSNRGKQDGPIARGGEGGRPADDADTTLTDDEWMLTLGREQYDWLTRTLESSTSRHRFVFIHHLVGGRGRSSRGGVESAPYFEWGGKNADGSDGFAAHRPGWKMPIHQLLAKHQVSAVFHGHDHLYVHNQLDGVTYQCVPQPGNTNGGIRSAREYGYKDGEVLGSPGYLRVTVATSIANIEYVRLGADDPADEAGSPKDRWDVTGSYRIGARTATPE